MYTAHRYRRENVIVAGVIPGSVKQEDIDMDAFMEPIVDELLDLWAGVQLEKTFAKPSGTSISAGAS
jgi:hypothetical protein